MKMQIRWWPRETYSALMRIMGRIITNNDFREARSMTIWLAFRPGSTHHSHHHRPRCRIPRANIYPLDILDLKPQSPAQIPRTGSRILSLSRSWNWEKSGLSKIRQTSLSHLLSDRERRKGISQLMLLESGSVDKGLHRCQYLCPF
jgi:hypothetical protein